ncbi:hypothetical protein ACF3OC_03610 [Sphingobacterium cellulitidis]|uniref:hypothetical protein n=1 Tax=Sphingobacterium cellulitidis TaxID=1768011 RepID=UPI00370DA05B
MKIYVNNGQWFSDIQGLCPIPHGTLINKALPGLGGTKTELDFERHSIIIVPNIPVIRGKMEKYPKILGVYNATTNKQIEEYFKDESKPYKKFITTPESFERIVRIGKKLGYKIYEDFFLLFDECDRATKDVGFREKIVKPLKHLPFFKNYAFISATAFVPSDPLLGNLTQISIIPTYSIAKEIDLVCTNHPYEALKETIINSKRKVFVFCSSLRVINRALTYLEIFPKSAIFCSEQRLEDMPDDLEYSESMIYIENTQKFNFLTSRFYAAVDIEIEEECEIVILSDVKAVSFTAIDPRSDAVQIIGRFRNKEAVKKVTVISNKNEDIDTMTKEELDIYFRTSEYLYNKIKLEAETRQNKVQKKVFEEYLKVIPFNRFIGDDGAISNFLIDNFKYDNYVLAKYKSYDALISAYISCKVPNSDIPYFKVEVIKKIYSQSSDDLYLPDNIKTYRDKIVHLVKVMDNLLNPEKKVNDIECKYLMLDKLKYHYPELFEAYSLLGGEELSNLYSKDEVLKAIKDIKTINIVNDVNFTQDVYNTFNEGDKLEGKDIKEKLKELFKKHNIDHIYPTISFLRKYYSIPEKGEKGKGQNRNKTFYKLGLKV